MSLEQGTTKAQLLAPPRVTARPRPHVVHAELTWAERARIHAATGKWIIGRAAHAIGDDAEIVVHHLDAALELRIADRQSVRGPALGLASFSSHTEAHLGRRDIVDRSYDEEPDLISAGVDRWLGLEIQ